MDKEKLYQVTKIIAENDSIGEGWNYWDDYSRERFEQDLLKHEAGEGGMWLSVAIEIYQLFDCLVRFDTHSDRNPPCPLCTPFP